jgi:4-hydroxy-tetrahydrodipicolinate synthase
MRLTGLLVPLVTPFTAAGELAGASLEVLAQSTLDDGATGLVALGTTAEAATLTAAERRTIVDLCAGVCGERGAPLIVGVGSNSTAASIDAISRVDARASAALVVVPYYSRPSEDGVVEHFRRLAAACPVPVLVYHVPYRTGRPLTAGTLDRLARLPNVAGFKHAVGGIDDDTVSFLSATGGRSSVLAGDDLHAAPMLARGASGAIMASANVATRSYADLVAAWRGGSTDQARALHDRLVPLTRALFAEPNPVVVKAVLARLGRIPSPYVRLPLLAASAAATAAALECLPISWRRAAGTP